MRYDAWVLPFWVPPVVSVERVVYPLRLGGFSPNVPEVGPSPVCLVVVSPDLLDNPPVEPLEYG